MVFKYPPWILPVFIPFALFPLGVAKLLWALGELASIYWLGLWTYRAGARFWIVALTLVLFWGVWAVHAMDGQADLLFLVASLAGGAAFVRTSWALSGKVFGLFAVVGLVFQNRSNGDGKPSDPAYFVWRNGLSVVLGTVGVLILTGIVLIWPKDVSPLAILRSWVDAARSGEGAFSREKIYGRDNQGLPALIFRFVQVDFYLVFGVCALGAGLFWKRISKNLNQRLRWAGWLALSAAIHPLAWFHVFVFAYPLVVFSLEWGFRSQRKLVLGLAILGTIMITMVTRKTLGGVGETLELISIKAWGVFLCCIAVGLADKVGPQREIPT